MNFEFNNNSTVDNFITNSTNKGKKFTSKTANDKMVYFPTSRLSKAGGKVTHNADGTFMISFGKKKFSGAGTSFVKQLIDTSIEDENELINIGNVMWDVQAVGAGRYVVSPV